MAGRPPKRCKGEGSELPRVEAVERALALLACFGEGRTHLALKELAEAAGQYPSTVLRLSGSLERFGYLRREADGRFRLGPAVLPLARVYRLGFPLEGIIRPALQDLSRESGETAAFYIREGEARLCLYRVNGPRPLRSHLEEGSLLPLVIGASGHVLSVWSGAGHPREAEIRAAGHAVSRGERDPDSAAVAAPVFGADGALLGALGLSGPITRFGAGEVPRLAGLVQAMAARLSAAVQAG
ncbi:MAG: IclR family transcriptional regulator [Beijerinckiaceae bacterium]|nr:IclR family transcriptional regulator [Beijerinckiaceae bacterium]MCZ8301768.1 IclR family transcriptional regulator [Beijerinckiaceae bacterium]